MKTGENNMKCAGTVRVGEKGQIVIPKEMRAMFHIEPGDILLVLCDKKRGIAIPPHGLMESLMTKLFESEEDLQEESNEEAEP